VATIPICDKIPNRIPYLSNKDGINFVANVAYGYQIVAEKLEFPTQDAIERAIFNSANISRAITAFL
jgi:hypothetical protein